jgi:hypothetical protein
VKLGRMIVRSRSDQSHLYHTMHLVDQGSPHGHDSLDCVSSVFQDRISSFLVPKIVRLQIRPLGKNSKKESIQLSLTMVSSQTIDEAVSVSSLICAKNDDERKRMISRNWSMNQYVIIESGLPSCNQTYLNMKTDVIAMTIVIVCGIQTVCECLLSIEDTDDRLE